MVQKFCAGDRWFGKADGLEILSRKSKKELARMLQKIQFSPEKYRYLEWTEERGNKGKKCTSTARKIGQTQIQRKDYT